MLEHLGESNNILKYLGSNFPRVVDIPTSHCSLYTKRIIRDKHEEALRNYQVDL